MQHHYRLPRLMNDSTTINYQGATAPAFNHAIIIQQLDNIAELISSQNTERLSSGMDYVIKVPLASPTGELMATIKVFKRQNLVKDWYDRRNGSKAERSFRAASYRQRPVILYHSTFSPSWSTAEILYAEIERLSQSNRWQWVVTLHPKMNPEIIAKYRTLENENLQFATNDNILELFPQADMMCSDTSSALTEFLLTGKPVVTFNNRRPSPQLIDIRDPKDVESAIERALSRPAELMQEKKLWLANSSLP